MCENINDLRKSQKKWMSKSKKCGNKEYDLEQAADFFVCVKERERNWYLSVSC